MILLHGLFGMGSNLGALARALQTDAPVYTVDLPNHGRSAWVPTMSLAALAEQLRAGLEPIALQGAYLVGHSLGGKIAMQLALQNPEWVSALVVADIAPVDYEPRHDAVFAALRKVEQAQPKTRRDARVLLQSSLDELGVADFLALSLETTPEGVRWRFNLEVLEAEYREVLRAPQTVAPYRGPTLFLKGERSFYILPEHLPSIRRCFPASRIHQLAGTGHWLHAEKPERFNQLVRDFLLESGMGNVTASASGAA